MNFTDRPTSLPGIPGEPASQNDHQPGQWPAACRHVEIQADPNEDAWAALQAERASRAAVLGRIRQHLEQQPNPRAVRAAARRWGTYITALGEDVINELGASQ